MLAINQILQGRYRIIRQLGHGGMGAVYEAIDERFGEPIALKEIVVDFANEKQKERVSRAFEREAKSLAKAKHEAVPFVRDYFSEFNRQFLVMELVEGEDLGEMLEKRRSPFPLQDVLNWMDQLLDALDYLHNLKPAIIHRDIKPQNLKLSVRQRIKLLDFGVARSTDKSSAVTKQTFVGATLDYSPIEQILRVINPTFREFIILKHKERAEKVLSQDTDARCDIYALGGTFYQLLTHHPPIDSTKRTLDVWEGKKDPLVNPSEYNPLIPEAISGILLKALAIERRDRYSSALEMQQALKNALAESEMARLTAVIAESKSGDLEIRETQLDFPKESLKIEIPKTEIPNQNPVTEISEARVSKENVQTEIFTPKVSQESLQTQISEENLHSEMPTDFLPPRSAPTQLVEERPTPTQFVEAPVFETQPSEDLGVVHISETVPSGEVSNPELTDGAYLAEFLPEEIKSKAEPPSILNALLEKEKSNRRKLFWVIPIALFGVFAVMGLGGMIWLGMSLSSPAASNKSVSNSDGLMPAAAATATPVSTATPTPSPTPMVTTVQTPSVAPTNQPKPSPIQSKIETPKPTVAATPNKTQKPNKISTPAKPGKTPNLSDDCIYNGKCG